MRHANEKQERRGERERIGQKEREREGKEKGGGGEKGETRIEALDNKKKKEYRDTLQNKMFINTNNLNDNKNIS